MTPARIVIVDDEQPARSRMRELLADCAAEFPHTVTGEAANGIEGLELVSATQADLALVDIHMPGMSGIEFARHLQVLEQPPAVIFVTAHDQYAVQAFEVDAVDYLLKPVRAARLLAALKKSSSTARPGREVLERIDPNPRRYFSVGERGRVSLVPVPDVVFLKAELKYVTIRTREREYLIEDSLSQIEKEFAETFVRIHRNCLVSRALIRGVERGSENDADAGWSVILDGCSEKLPVSRRQWTVLKELLKA
jgi:two-component system, LytTR family, response regulator AlgR